MEEADQEFEDLLHCLNLPGPPWVPVRSLPAAPKSPAVRFCRVEIRRITVHLIGGASAKT